MIGDYKNIWRSFNFCKALGAFGMVVAHGFAVVASHSDLKIDYFSWTYRGFCIIGAGPALCLPLVAGFYLRGEVAPYLSTGRIPKSFIRRGLAFLAIAFALEALRLFSILWSPTYIFNWHALHFIGLSLVITYVLLSLQQRTLLLFLGLLIVGSPFLSAWLAPLQTTSDALTSSQMQTGAIFWCVLFAILTGLLLNASRLLGRIRKPVAYTVAVVAVSLLVAFSLEPRMATDHRAMLSFVNLPIAMFFNDVNGDNYWPLAVFFPIFISGYYIRAFLWNRSAKKFFPAVVVASFAYLAYFLAYRLNDFEATVGARTLFTKSMYGLDFGLVLGLICFYFCLLVTVYYAIRRIELPIFMQKIAHYSRSTLVLYMVHPVLFVLLGRYFPFLALKNFLQGLPTYTPSQEVFLPVYIMYFISLIISHRVMCFIEGNRTIVESLELRSPAVQGTV